MKTSLDKVKFTEQYIRNCGAQPSEDVLRTYEAITAIAFSAYKQGAEGKPFEPPFAVKNT